MGSLWEPYGKGVPFFWALGNSLIPPSKKMPHGFNDGLCFSGGIYKSSQQAGKYLDVLGQKDLPRFCKVNTFGATVSSTWSGD